MPLATKDMFLAKRPLAYEDVPCPELGPDVLVRVQELSGEQRDAYDASLWKSSRNGQKLDLTNATALLVSMSCVDESGSPLFDQSDVLSIGKRNGAKLLKRISSVAMRLSNIEEEEIETLAKNSTSATQSESGGASQNGSVAPSGKQNKG